MSDPTIDVATFAALQEMAGADFADELIGTFLEEAPTMLADLRAALAGADAERYRRAAHSLKSNATTFGATQLAALAKGAELGGMNADSGATLDAIDAEYARVATALTAMRHG